MSTARASAPTGRRLAWTVPAAVLFGLGAAACASSDAPPAAGKARPVPAGIWSARGILVTVTEAGAEIAFSCAHASISAPLHADADGHVSGTGVYERESPGPTREGERGESTPLRLDAGLPGDDEWPITLTIASKTQTHVLTHKPTRIQKCR